MPSPSRSYYQEFQAATASEMKRDLERSVARFHDIGTVASCSEVQQEPPGELGLSPPQACADALSERRSGICHRDHMRDLKDA